MTPFGTGRKRGNPLYTDFTSDKRSSCSLRRCGQNRRSRILPTHFLPNGRFAGSVAVAGFLLSTCCLASGLRGLQSAGGKETRQKREHSVANSTPTSRTPLVPSAMSITVQIISSVVERLVSVSTWPKIIGSRISSKAPWALTIKVVDSSAIGGPLALFPEIRSGTESTMRWLRRCFVEGTGRGFGVVTMLPSFLAILCVSACRKGAISTIRESLFNPDNLKGLRYPTVRKRHGVFQTGMPCPTR
jgi:hypothetical protein